MRVKLFKIFVCLLFVSFCVGQSDIENKVVTCFTNGHFKHSNNALSIIEIASEKEVVSFNSRTNLIPASTFKVFTAFIALDVLSKDHKFITHFGYNGVLYNEGTLDGNLILKASGDPTLGSLSIKKNKGNSLSAQLVKKTLEKGINCVNGKLIIDLSDFSNESIPPTWQWNDIANYYGSASYPLNYLDNQYTLTFDNSTSIGSTAKVIGTEPELKSITFENFVSIDHKNSGDQAYIFGSPFDNIRRIRGTIPKGKGQFKIKGALPDPPVFFGELLLEELRAQNIQIDKLELISKNQKINQSILKIHSPSLASIINKVTYDSNNLYAEALLNALGSKFSQYEKNLAGRQNGINFIEQYLKNRNYNSEEFKMHDASGLSARNRVSAFTIAQFLGNQIKAGNEEEILKYMPKAGKEGTVKNLQLPQNLKDNLWLKSGSMEGILAYCGYIQSKSNKYYSISFMTNGSTKPAYLLRKQMIELLESIYNELD